MKKTLLTLSIVAALGTLTACGGGSSSDSSNNNNTGGSTATASRNVSGVITAVNAGAAKTLAGVTTGTTVTVNGVDYALETDSSIDMDDAEGSEADLAEGQVVNMDVSDDDGDGVYSVDVIEYDDELEGYVLANDLAATGTLNVMGKVVHVDTNTKYEGGDLNKATIDLLAAGDVVEVSGYPDANGEIIATRIEGKGAGEDVEVKGTVSNVDDTEKTFKLGTLIVDYSAADMGDIPGGVPTDGLYVEAKSAEDMNSLQDNGDGTYTLKADKVELQDGGDMEDDSADEGEEMEITGVLTVDATGVSSVNGQILAASADAGITEGQIAALEGVLVEVEGYIENGALVVTEIQAAN